jgi:hypothetical protein
MTRNNELKRTSVKRDNRVRRDGQISLAPRVVPSASRPRRRDDAGLNDVENTWAEATTEQPVSFLTSGMTLWGAGVAAFMLIPLTAVALAASPILLASGLFMRPGSNSW